MNGSDIDFFLNKIPIFGGVIARDQMPEYPSRKIYVMNNLTIKQQGWGHWFVIDKTVPGGFFFDSFGNSPEFYGLKHINYSKHQLQSNNSATCAIYAIYYTTFRQHNSTPTQILSHFNVRKKQENDLKLLKWLKTSTKYKTPKSLLQIKLNN